MKKKRCKRVMWLCFWISCMAYILILQFSWIGFIVLTVSAILLFLMTVTRAKATEHDIFQSVMTYFHFSGILLPIMIFGRIAQKCGNSILYWLSVMMDVLELQINSIVNGKSRSWLLLVFLTLVLVALLYKAWKKLFWICSLAKLSPLIFTFMILLTKITYNKNLIAIFIIYTFFLISLDAVNTMYTQKNTLFRVLTFYFIEGSLYIMLLILDWVSGAGTLIHLDHIPMLMSFSALASSILLTEAIALLIYCIVVNISFSENNGREIRVIVNTANENYKEKKASMFAPDVIERYFGSYYDILLMSCIVSILGMALCVSYLYTLYSIVLATVHILLMLFILMTYGPVPFEITDNREECENILYLSAMFILLTVAAHYGHFLSVFIFVLLISIGNQYLKRLHKKKNFLTQVLLTMVAVLSATAAELYFYHRSWKLLLFLLATGFAFLVTAFIYYHFCKNVEYDVKDTIEITGFAVVFVVCCTVILFFASRPLSLITVDDRYVSVVMTDDRNWIFAGYYWVSEPDDAAELLRNGEYVYHPLSDKKLPIRRGMLCIRAEDSDGAVFSRYHWYAEDIDESIFETMEE